MKISVAMCTYNGAQFIKEQLDSIFNQTLAIDELIICDDQSTDKSIEIINEYIEKYPNIIQLHINQNNLRSVKNFEKACKLCTGDVIFLCDQDDIWLEDKVEKHLAYYKSHPEINVIASNGYCIDEQSVVHDKYSLWDVPKFLEEQNIEYNYHHLISFIGNIATGASMSFKKDFHANIYPFPVIDGFHHDEWLARIASASNAFVLIPDKLFKYRIHTQQQVGGVFFDKTKKSKMLITESYSGETKKPFFVYKSLLKRVIKKHEHEIKIREYLQQHSLMNFDIFAKENILDRRLKIELLIQQMKNQYPIQSFCLGIVDKILKKRQLR